MSDDDIGFEEQLAQEAAVKARESKLKTRVEEDGTVMEWDPDKNAWFPKIDDDFIAKYQMSYGSGQTSSTSADTASTATATSSTSAPPPVTDPAYYNWYYSHYQQAGSSTETPPTDSKEYEEWYKKYYEYYYSQQSQKEGDKKEDGKDEDNDSGVEKSDSAEKSDKDSASDKSDNQDQEYSDYWSYYYNYYGYEQQGEQGEQSEQAATAAGGKEGEKDTKKGKKGKIVEKRKDPVWFDADEKQHTNVYVSGLPTDITEQEFEELMKKCGLVMLDVKTRKLKLKLYQNEDGTYKGDGRCCYIKSESVDLALQVLDGSDVRGNTIQVERAKFTMKGEFDAVKAKRRKMTNKEKKRLREKQEKLFDWRPDKPAGTRGKNERVVIIKNVFDPKEFDKDPGLINEIRNDMREECGKYGDVRKVVVHDRHADGVVSVTMREPEEADVCLEAVSGRWFGGKQLQASTWDGKTKYEVEETEAERDARLKQWDNFLAGQDGSEKKEPTSTTDNPPVATPPVSTTTENTPAAASSTEPSSS